MIRRISTASLAAFLFLGVGPALAEVRLPAIFSDHMVLQRECDVPVWGWASPGEEIAVSGSWQAESVARATADDRGRWRVTIRTPEAGGPHQLNVVGASRIELRDVLVGEVWLGSGQSNMEWRVRQCLNGAIEAAAADYPAIRVFDVQNRAALHAGADVQGRWVICRPEAAAEFSATGFYFARELHRELRVPIGLITADWGGTRIEAWMSAEALAEFPEPAAEIERYKALADPDRRVAFELERREGWWNRIAAFDPGGPDAAWTRADFDDASWKKTDVPATLAGDGLENFDGLVYYRSRFDLPAEWAGAPATLELGPIDDRDDAWVNGVRVGGTREDGQWSVDRAYDVPAGVLRAGANIVAVRVLDTAGPGGINGRPEQLRIRRGESDDAVPLAGEWRLLPGRPMRDLPPMDSSVVHQNSATALYQGMIAPLIPCRIAGAIWYQGESNRGNAAEYRRLFPKMIESWRKAWGRPFPFYFVQIAPYRYGGDEGQTAQLREAQAHALRTPETGMVVTMDIGDPADIHPANKQEVGRRLALWALSKTYGRAEVVCSGPIYNSMRTEDDAALISFSHAEGGLIAKGGRLLNWETAGADGRFHPAEAELYGVFVRVRSAEVPTPTAVRYGWCNDCEPNLFNAAGLPAAPFRTDAP